MNSSDEQYLDLENVRIRYLTESLKTHPACFIPMRNQEGIKSVETSEELWVVSNPKVFGFRI